ncbi:pol, partial [Symbiodinium sp. KB8]
LTGKYVKYTGEVLNKAERATYKQVFVMRFPEHATQLLKRARKIRRKVKAKQKGEERDVPGGPSKTGDNKHRVTKAAPGQPPRGGKESKHVTKEGIAHVPPLKKHKTEERIQHEMQARDEEESVPDWGDDASDTKEHPKPANTATATAKGDAQASWPWGDKGHSCAVQLIGSDEDEDNPSEREGDIQDRYHIGIGGLLAVFAQGATRDNQKGSPSHMEGVQGPGPAPPAVEISDDPQDEPGSPPKRGRKAEQQLTLDMLKEVLAAGRTKDRQHLADSLHAVKGDIDQIRARVDAVEGGVTQQMHNTLAMLTKITNNYDDQAQSLAELKQGQRGMEDRIAALEKQPAGSVPASTTDTATEGGRRPAIIIRVWNPDQLATDTLQAAKDVLKQLDVPLNTDGMFVPGIRRGYAIVPIDHKPLESEEGAAPESRTQFSAFATRTCQESHPGDGGDQRSMDVEFATGTVWLGAHKVASATAEQPQGHEEAPARSGGRVAAAAGGAAVTTAEKFHQEGDPKGISASTRIASWNVGGLTAQQALELPSLFVGNRDLQGLTVLLLQEIICEVGTWFHEHEGWVIVYGKNEGDWRGTGIAYKAEGHKHTNTRLLTVVIAATISSDKGKQGIRYLSGHIPHHATVAQTEAIMHAWSSTLKKAKVVVGMDANEEFTDADNTGLRSHTARGEAILVAALPQGVTAPQQQLTVETYHPYNTQHRSRRLDYVMTRGVQAPQGGVAVGSRHLARSDHDLVWIQMSTVPIPKQNRPTWGARRFRKHVDINAIVGAPLKQEDTHTAIGDIALRTTVQGKYTSKFNESTALKMARKQAHASPAQDAREAWKKVNRMRKQELRAWHNNLVVRASQVDWYAYRTLSHLQRREGWHHKLVDEERWRETMRKHFEGIFAKAPKARTAKRLGDTRRALTALCKVTKWKPFTLDDLKVATVKWKSGKSTGPDAITHEILRYLLNDDRWGFRLTNMMNVFLYKGELPEGVLRGITVLLPKTLEDPSSWGDTRPITLSSAILKWFSQLLLKRCGGKIQDGAPYQWASRGKQAPELLVILRCVVRMAKDWGTPTWIIKLDVRK